MADWEIRKTLGQCCGTEEEFAVGQEYFAALVAIEEGFERRDFSVEYWQENKPEVYCFWKTKMVDPEHKKKLFIDDEMLMSFFERLGEETDTEKVNFRFVLTLVLMRKRKFPLAILPGQVPCSQGPACPWHLFKSGFSEIPACQPPAIGPWESTTFPLATISV